jgi:hypothetical protein
MKPLVVENRTETIMYLIAPVKGVVFLCSLAVLVSPVVRESSRLLKDTEWESFRAQCITSLKATFIMSLLIAPLSLQFMGREYGNMSLDPFAHDNILYFRRLLMPVIANILFLRGPILYFVFSLICNFILILLTQVWLVKNDIKLKFWQFVSLLTSSYVIFQFQSPGYTDVLLHIFLLLSVTFPFSERAKVTILTLSLLTHAVFSLTILVVLAFFLLDRDALVKYYLICILYIFFWMGGFGFSVSHAFHVHDARGLSGVEWVMAYPLLEILGIFFSFKLLWTIIVAALIILARKKQLKLTAEIALLLLCALALTFLGVDTSRHFGWSFYALLLSLKVVNDEAKRDAEGRLFNVIFIVNLLIPSIYVGLNTGLNTGITLSVGVYKLIIEIFQSLI